MLRAAAAEAEAEADADVAVADADVAGEADADADADLAIAIPFERQCANTDFQDAEYSAVTLYCAGAHIYAALGPPTEIGHADERNRHYEQWTVRFACGTVLCVTRRADVQHNARISHDVFSNRRRNGAYVRQLLRRVIPADADAEIWRTDDDDPDPDEDPDDDEDPDEDPDDDD